MNDLDPRERELVALGAAMGSNCVSRIEYHVREAKNAGLTDLEISAAIGLADKVRRVPARKVLDAALRMVASTPTRPEADHDDPRSDHPAAGIRTEGRCCS